MENDFSPDSLQKLLQAINFITRVSDQSKSPTVALLQTVLGHLIESLVTLRWDDSNRQFSFTNGSGGVSGVKTMSDLFREHPDLIEVMKAMVDAFPKDSRLAMLVHLSMQRLDAEI